MGGTWNLNIDQQSIIDIATVAAKYFLKNNHKIGEWLDDYVQEGCYGILDLINKGKIHSEHEESFIFHVAYNKCRERYFRYDKKHTKVKQEVMLHKHNGSSVDANEYRLMLEDICTSMSAKHVSWVKDKLRGDYTHEEVAALHGVTGEAVSKAFKRAAKKKGYIK